MNISIDHNALIPGILAHACRNRFRRVLAGVFCIHLLFLAGVECVDGQEHRGSPDALAVDVVFMTDGTKYYGVVTDKTSDRLTLAVERSWLETNHTEFYKKHLEEETVASRSAQSELIKRIDKWIEERPDEPELLFFLEEERKAASGRLTEVGESTKRFAYVNLEPAAIRRTVLQTEAQRQIALVAWLHNLENVASRSSDSLRRELEKLNIDINSTRVDFSDQVPSSPQSDREWALRKSIIEYDMRERIEFQGSGDSFFRQGEEINPMEMIKMMLSQGSGSQIQQIGEELGLPEFTRPDRERVEEKPSRDWWRKQAAEVEKAGLRSFTITRLKQNIMQADVNVEVFLIGKNEKNEWQVINVFNGTASAEDQNAADIDALKDDPQVKQILDVVEQLGLGNSGNVERAMLHGLATQAAMQDGRNRFFNFLQRYVDQLDGPKLVVPEP